MVHAHIDPGICGFNALVRASMNNGRCVVSIQSQCESIQRLAAVLPSLDPFQEISHRSGGSQVMELAVRHCAHAACPVPVGIIKAVEVEAGLAAAADVSIRFTKVA